MSFLSLLRWFGKRRPTGESGQRQRKSRPAAEAKKRWQREQLLLESLEERVVPAGTPPTILYTGNPTTSPADGSTVNAPHPSLQILFSEPMAGDNASQTGAANPLNYELVNSAGNPVTIDSVVMGTPDPVTHQQLVTLNYNLNQDLPANTYTLYVRGDQLVDAVNGIPLSQSPGQVIAGNQGTNQVSVINIPENGTLAALSNYALPNQAGLVGVTTPPPLQANPGAVAVAFADVDRDGIDDMIVANANPDPTTGLGTLSIFQGHIVGTKGLTFDLAPDKILSLPAPATVTATTPLKAFIATADFNGDGKTDIAVTTTATNQVTVYLNTSITPGSLTFGSPAYYSTANSSPMGLAVGAFSNRPAGSSGKQPLDLAVVDNTADKNGYYNLEFFLGDGQGNFTAPPAGGNIVRIGDTKSGGAYIPNNLVSAYIDRSPGHGPDIIVSSQAGAYYLPNASSGSINFPIWNTNWFAVPLPVPLLPPYTAGASGALVIGDFNGDGEPDVAIASNTGVTTLQNGTYGNRVSIYMNTAGGLALATTFDTNATGTAYVAMAVGDANLDGQQDLFGITYDPNFTKQAGTVEYHVNTSNGAVTSFGAAFTAAQPDGFPEAIAIADVDIVNYVTQTDNDGDLLTQDQKGNLEADVVAVVNQNANNRGPNPPAPPGGDDITILTNTQVANPVPNPSSQLQPPSPPQYYQPTNSPPPSPPAPIIPSTLISSVATGDLNGDGIPDIVTAYRSLASGNPNTEIGSVISVQLGLGGGKYAPAQYFLPDTGAAGAPSFLDIVSVAIGDVTGDGLPDIVLLDQQDSLATVLVNNWNGSTLSFTPQTPFAVGGKPMQVVLADFNNDGHLDMAVAHDRPAGGGGGASQGVSVILNSGNPAAPFQGQIVQEIVPAIPAINADALAVADFNRDGNMDIAVVNDSIAEGQVIVLHGDGKGNFSEEGTFKTGVIQPDSIAIADLNLDGFPDIIVASKSASATFGGVGTLINGHGSFSGSRYTITHVLPGTGLVSVAAVDLGSAGADATGTANLAANGTVNNVAISDGGTGYTTPPTVVFSGGGGTGAMGTALIVNGEVIGVEITNPGSNYTSAPTVKFLRDSDPFPDIVVSTLTNVPPPDPSGTTKPVDNDNLFALQGLGNGRFMQAVPYVGAPSFTAPAPTYITATPSPLIRVTTFTIVDSLVNVNLVSNGDFESVDQSGEQGNLDGWQTYDLATTPGSHGSWQPQSGLFSPVSLAAVPKPTGTYQAMLDEADQSPIYTGAVPVVNNNTPASYAGSHALYQDIVLPVGFTSLTLTYSLYIDDSNAKDPNNGLPGFYSDTSANPPLNWQPMTQLNQNQQVRVDILDPTNPNFDPLSVTSGTGWVYMVYGTTPNDQAVETLTPTFNLTQALKSYAGREIELRFAVTNNMGKIIVGVDNVKLIAQFTDTTPPTVSPVQLRNPGFLSATDSLQHTNDPTVIGRVGDNGSINNVSYIEVNPNGTGLGLATNENLTTYDALGNFAFTIPNLEPGSHTVTVAVHDVTGQVSTQTFTFYYQGTSTTEWTAYGPNGIDVSGQNVDYSTVSGRVTAIYTDPTDLSGNTYWIGSVNGGVWKTTDGGASWTPEMDYLKDSAGNALAASIGGLAGGIDHTDPAHPGGNLVLYAGTGVADTNFDSPPGVGIFKSTDGGKTWGLAGNSGTVLAGARISKMVVDDSNSSVPPVVYVAVASGPNGPGVYRSLDGGATWTNILDPTLMYNSAGVPLGAGAALPSVTDIVLDPFHTGRLLIGLGNIGLAGSSGLTGVYKTVTGNNAGGVRWDQVVGGSGNINLSTLPASGVGMGRVTLAIGTGRAGDENTFYVMIGTPPGNNTAPNVDLGTFTGLYKTSNNGLDFTQVMLKQNIGTAAAPNFVNINLLGQDSSEAGSLLVDRTDPNVVYVGGSGMWQQTGGAPNHVLLRVDTGDMRDASYTDPNTKTIPNDGDDIQKALQAEKQGNKYTGGSGYTGEGVSWYDLEAKGSGGAATLVTEANGTTRPANYLPNSIHALSFDTQGRLLIGTGQGIWRAVGLGQAYGYDFTSGGSGILYTTVTGAQLPGEGLTSINGNLQISDLTSVAIDPSARGVLYTTQANTGTARANGSLDWVSSQLVGPVVNGTNLGLPTAGSVVVSTPAPNAAAGTPTTVYVVWQFANPTALDPQVSIDSGNSFGAVTSAGIPTDNPLGSDPAAMFPAFAVDPSKVQAGSQYFDALLFGTNGVFETNTSAIVWDQIGNRPISSIGGLITALAIAPSNSNVLYAGDDKGEIFVTMNNGVDNWLLRTNGLPPINQAKVTSINVDASNPLIAYATFSANSTGEVYRTVDGGQNWTNITSNLPAVSVYTLAYDPRTTGGASHGRLYIGNDVGVYISLDLGTTWQPLGQGMPHVPVVDLQLNTKMETLAAATLGRGAFTLSTDLIGPHVTQIQATPGVNSVYITFNEPIQVPTLTANQITLVGPNGQVAPASISVVDVDPSNHDLFQIVFPKGSAPGNYTIAIAPTVTDLVGNPMDQNQNGIGGENPGDIYQGRFLYQTTIPNTAPTLNQTTATLGNMPENAASNPGFSLSTFVASLNITDPDPGAIRGIAITSVDNSKGQWQYSLDSGTTWINISSSLSPSSALLLGAWSTEYLRFVPAAPNFVGSPTFTFVAWDLTTGTNPVDGGDALLGSTLPAGGSTAFSTAVATGTVKVVYANAAPSFTAGPNISVMENSGFQSIPWATNLNVGQPDDAGQTLNFIVSNNNPGLFAVQPAIDSNGVLTFTPQAGVVGTAVVTVQLHDNGGTANGGQDTSAPQTFLITIGPVNQPPSFTVGPNLSYTRDAGSITVPNWATNIAAGPPNEAGQAVNFLVTANNPALFTAGPAIAPNGTLTFTLSGVAGMAVITVQLHDNGGTANGGQDTSAPQQFTITVGGLAFHGTPIEVWVASAYLDILNRPVDPAGLIYWTDQLEADLPRTTAAEMILNSAEYRTNLIRQQFQTLLGRAASAADVNTFLQLFGQGITIEQFKAMILSSPEYLSHHGGGNVASWLNAVYQDVLGRPIDSGGVAYWGAKVQAQGMNQVALLILQSPEADGDLVVKLYEQLLGRAPQPSEGVNGWWVMLQQGARDETVTAGILASDAYFTRWIANFNEVQMQNWITGVYQDVLGRPIDSGGEGIWINALNHGLSRQFVVREIVNSHEFQVHEITGLYEAYLNRTPDPTGLNYGLGILAQGGTIEQVKASILGSAEYYFGHGGGTANGFLSALYHDVLGQSLNDAGVAFWGTKLANGEDRTTLAAEMLATQPAADVVVQNYYLATLRRSADPTGLAYWTAQILSGGLPDAYVLAGLAASREYYNRFPNS